MGLERTAHAPIDVIILTVIAAELQAMKHALQISEQERITIDGTKYYPCTVYSENEQRRLRVVLGFVGEAGEESAAAATMAALKDFRPQALLLTGIAAGIRGEVKIGNVVISNRVVATSKQAIVEQQVSPGVIEPQKAPDIERLTHSMRQSLTSYKSAYESSLERINQHFGASGGTFPSPEPGKADDYAQVASQIMWCEGSFASENTLWRSATELRKLPHEYHRQIIAAEMEAAGVLEACRRMGVPWLVLRGISDFGDHFKNDSFHAFASQAVAAVLIDFLVHGLDVAFRPTYEVSGPSPFLGLSNYSYSDHERYAGRQQEIREAVAALVDDRAAPALMFVMGASGSGKSSLVRAGILPAVVQAYQRDYGYQVKKVEEWRPGDRPLVTLRHALLQLGLPMELISDEQIRDRPESLIAFLRAHTPERQRNLVVIDQFEEFFALTDKQPAIDQRPHHRAIFAFLSALPRAIDLRTQFIATMRTQFLEDLSLYPALHAIAFEKPSIALSAMSIDELKQTIQAPLNWLNATQGTSYAIERALLMRLAEEAEHDPAYLSLLQTTLDDLWESGRLETPPDFQGIAQAIGDRAERIITGKRVVSAPAKRKEGEQQIIMHLFLDLVDVSLYGENRREVRRSRTIDELVQVDQARTPLIEELCAARLLTNRNEVLDDAESGFIEIIHESLIDKWPRLNQAIRHDYAILQQRRNFEQKEALWLAKDRSLAYLLTGADLAEAQALQARKDVAFQNQDAADFLRRSVARRNLVRNSITSTLIVLLIAAIIAALWALGQTAAAEERRQEAEAAQAQEAAQRTVAEKQSLLARSSALNAQSQVVAANLPQLGLLLLLESLRLAQQMGNGSTAVEDILRESLARSGGVTLIGHEAHVSRVIITDDNRWIITESDDDTVRLWPFTPAAPSIAPVVLRQPHHALTILGTSADSHWLVTGALDPDSLTTGSTVQQILLWDLSAPNPAKEGIDLTGSPGLLIDARVSLDRRYVIASDAGKTIRIWDLTAPDPAQDSITQINEGPPRHTIAVSPDSRWLVTVAEDAGPGVSADNTAHLWDLSHPSHNPIILRGHRAPVTQAVFSPDSGWLVTSSGDMPGGRSENTALLWNLGLPDPTAGAMVLKGHSYPVTQVAFSKQSRWLVTSSGRSGFAWADDDHITQLWDLAAKDIAKSVRILSGHTDFVSEIAISDNEHWLATTGESDASVYLWNLRVEDDLSPIVLEGAEERVESTTISISPDSRWLISVDGFNEPPGSEKHAIRLWDLASPDPSVLTRSLRCHTDKIMHSVFSPDSHRLMTGGSDGAARIWNLEASDPSAQAQVLHGNEGELSSIVVSPDSRWLITSSWGDYAPRIWSLVNEASNTTTSHILSAHEGGTGGYDVLTLSPDNRWLVISSLWLSTSHLWDLKAPDVSKAQISLGNDAGGVISSDSHWLATSKGLTVNLRDLRVAEPGAVVARLNRPGGTTTAIAMSPDGRWLAAGGGKDLIGGTQNFHVYIWDLHDLNAPPLDLAGHEDDVTSLSFSADSRWLVSDGGKFLRNSTDYNTILWDLRSVNPADTSRLLKDSTNNHDVIGFSLDMRWLITKRDMFAAEDSNPAIFLWDLTDKNPAATPLILQGDASSSVVFFSLSPDNRWLATTDTARQNSVQLWDLASPDPLAAPLSLGCHDEPISYAAFSPDTSLFVASGETAACIWDAAKLHSGTEPRIVHTNDQLFGFLISPDKRWLIAYLNPAVRMWDLSQGSENDDPVVLRGHQGVVGVATFSSDGDWLITGSDDQTVRLWPLRQRDLIDLACRTAGRNLSPAEWQRYVGDEPYRRTCTNLPLHPAFFAAARNLARAGDIEGAISQFTLVIELDPGLDIDPEREAHRAAAQGLIERGKEHAGQARIEEAITAFRQALELDPELDLDPEMEANRIMAQYLIEQARNVAGQGDLDAATSMLRRALELDPELDLIPEQEARQAWVSGIVVRAQILSQGQDFEGARADFEEALKLDPSLRSYIAWQLQQMAQLVALSDNTALAIELFERVRVLDPDADLRDSVFGLVQKAGRLASEGQIEQAIKTYETIHSLAPTLRVPWNNLCRSGALGGQASKVLGACDRAVLAAPDDGAVRDSRGIARALTGNEQGAIEDFAFFIEWSQANGKYEAHGRKREIWIMMLQAGQNPFDAATLSDLLSE